MLTLPASNDTLSSNGSFAAVNGSNGLYGTWFIPAPVTTLRAFKLTLPNYGYNHNGEDNNNWSNDKYANHHQAHIVISLVRLVDCLINCRIHRLCAPLRTRLIFGGN